MKKNIFIIIIILFSIPFVTFAEVENVGIIKGIWFSNAEFFDGDTIRIYTAIQNNSGSDVEGSIEFFDNGVSIGIKSFSALNSRIIESWIDTIAVSGEHEFSVKIKELQKNDVDLGIESITAESIFSERIAVIKIDTDGDNIPDDIDEDDDGDGYSDDEERFRGSDPLNKNNIPKNIEQEQVKTNNIFEQFVEKYFSTNKDTDISQEEDFLNQAPDFIQDLAEKNSFIENIASRVTKIQNTSNNIINKERERILIQKDKLYPKTENLGLTNNKEKNPKNNQSKILISFYVRLLGIISWLFKTWWFTIILLFLGIYLVLKLLFKIFASNK